MKGIVNLPKALRNAEILPPVKQTGREGRTFATIPGNATIVSPQPDVARLVPIEDNIGKIPSLRQAEEAYGVIKKNAPELAGRIVNILV